jgi:hypothetical protein
MPIKLANNASGTLATAISASDTGLVLTTGDGAEFPTLGAGDYFYATLASSGGTQEIVKATARSGDSLTIVRAQEGTTAQSFAAGSRFELRVTAASVNDRADLAESEANAYADGLDTTLRANLAASSGSSLIGFLQAGTSAVARTTQAKLRETVSVKDFGAVGDGVTDDTAAFQAAIAAGDIVIPEGQYILKGGLAPSAARYIKGNGGSYKTPVLFFDAGSYTQCINLPELSTVDGIRIVDNTNSKIGIQINGTYNSVRNCVIEGCDIGIYYFANNQGNSEIKDNFIRNSVTANVKCFRAHNVILTGNRLEYGQYGLWFDTACYDNMVIGNEISHNSVRGIFTDSTSVATKIVGNDFGAHGGVGLYMSKYQDSVIGNHFTDITGNAIYADVNVRSAVISGNTFKNCSPGLAVIQLQSECDNYQITDNIFGRLDIAPVADYCIRVRFGDKVRITGNHFTFGYLTAPILDEFPQGPVIYSDFVQQTIVTNTDVAAGLASVLTSRPVPAVGGYTVAVNVGPGRALTCTITNPTGAAINVPELWFYRQPGLATSQRKVIPPQTLAPGASATFVGYAENTTSDQVVLIPTGGVIPAGLTFTCGVSDRFRLRENIDSLTGVSGTNGAAPLTLSAFDVTDRSFLVSPSPATGSTLLFSYQRSLNFS